MRNSCLIVLFHKNTEAATGGAEAVAGAKFCKLHRRTPVFEAFEALSCRPSAYKYFKKKLQRKCFPVKFAKLLRTAIWKNICKRRLLEEFYKKAVLKNFAIFTGRKKLVISVLFLVVDGAVKVTCFYIDQHLL